MRVRASLIAWTVLLGAPLQAQDLLLSSVSLEEYAKKAVEDGIRGRLTVIALESAGYTRDISFRLTDSPDMTVTHSVARTETTIEGSTTRADTKATALTLNQPTALGTNIQAVGTYDDANKPGFQATAVQPIYIFRRNATARVRQRAELNFRNAQDFYDADVLAIRSQARSLYYDVMLTQEFIKVEERKSNSSRKLLDITQALVQAGKKAAVETMRAKIRKQADERQLQNAFVNRDKAIAGAKNFISHPADQPLTFTSRLSFRPFQLTLGRLMEYASMHRPQLRALRRNQELARLTVQEIREATRPGLSANGTYSHTDFRDITTESWRLGGGVSWLFFDSFVTSKRTREALLDQWVADLNVEDAERVLALQVGNAYRDVKNAERQIADFQTSREQAKHNTEVIRLRFQNGLERLIDVFDAENDMRNLDNEYLNLVVSYNRATDTLSELVGADVWGIR
jgi:outer membrane protein TolC